MARPKKTPNTKEVQAPQGRAGENTSRIVEHVLQRKYTNKEFSAVTIKFMNAMVDKMKARNIPISATRLKDIACTYGVIWYGMDAYVEVIHNELGSIQDFKYFLSTIGYLEEPVT